MLRPVGEVYSEYVSATPKEGKENKEMLQLIAIKVTLKVVKHEWVPRYIGDKKGHMVSISEPIGSEYV
jgi:hypothetical protein